MPPVPVAGQTIRAATIRSDGYARRGHIPRTSSTVTSVSASRDPFPAHKNISRTVWTVRYETPTRDCDGAVIGTTPGFVWLTSDELHLVEVVS